MQASRPSPSRRRPDRPADHEVAWWHNHQPGWHLGDCRTELMRSSCLGGSQMPAYSKSRDHCGAPIKMVRTRNGWLPFEEYSYGVVHSELHAPAPATLMD